MSTTGRHAIGQNQLLSEALRTGLALLAAGAPLTASGQNEPAERFGVDIRYQQNAIHLTYPSRSSSYYQVWAGDTMDEALSIVAVHPGADGLQEWADTGPEWSERERRFYCVRALTPALAEDEDNDGLDGWFELNHSFLDAMDDADAVEDQDGDGINNLAEYRRRTDLSNPMDVHVTLYSDRVIGNDGYDGLSATVEHGHGPVRTLQRAIDAAYPGDMVQMAPGYYAGNIVITKSLTLDPMGLVTIGSSELHMERTEPTRRN